MKFTGVIYLVRWKPLTDVRQDFHNLVISNYSRNHRPSMKIESSNRMKIDHYLGSDIWKGKDPDS